MNEKLLTERHDDAFKNIPEEDQHITREKILKLLPKGTTARITDDILEMISNMGESVDLPQNLLEEELMSYMHLLKGRGTSIVDLINATKYCNLKRNYTNEKAWSIVFPHRWDRLKKMGKDIQAHVAMFNGSKIVQAIDKELLIPASLQYAPYFHAAVKKQYELMNGQAGLDRDGENIKVSAMVMHLAAKELALITKQPEETKLDIKVSASDEALELQRDMNSQLNQLVKNQRARLEAGEDITDVQKIGISFNVESEEVIDV